jgi:hypothetical protein
MKLTITEKTAKPFVGDEGNEIEYYWYKGVREDGIAIRFGSTDGEHEMGKTVEINLEKTERIDKKGNVKIGYKETH